MRGWKVKEERKRIIDQEGMKEDRRGIRIDLKIGKGYEWEQNIII
jgi:hypothetical protein